MSFQNNPNIIKATGTVREINGRSFLGRNGTEDVDDIWHYAYLVVEDTKGELLKFERVTTNEKIDPEIEVGNSCTFYFRRIWGWKKSVFHLVASESEARGMNYFSLFRTMDILRHRLLTMGIVPGSYLFGLLLFALPAKFTIGLGNVFWLALIVPVFMFVLFVYLANPALVRKDSLALQKELEHSRGGQKFDGRGLKTV